MKILLLNTSSRTGGAAVAASRLRTALERQGVEVAMLVRDQSPSDRTVPVCNSWFGRKVNRFRFYWERLMVFLCNHFNRADLFRVSIANTGTDLSRVREVVEADIIHLHWINQGLLSLEDLRKLIRLGKPVVWTMHDMWPCTGICHHARECEAFQQHCGSCFYLSSHSQNDLSARVFRKKRLVYASADISFVGCSRWLAERARKSALLAGKNVLSIPNPIDLSVFCPKEKQVCREKLHLPREKRLLLFGALNVTDTRKGVDYLLKALSLLGRDNLELVVFGQVKTEIKQLVPVPIHSMGYLSDEKTIADLYNAVDLFVTSSLEENLPNTLMESLACGTPCVGFRVGGIPEMIDHRENGYVADYQSAEDLARGIAWVLDYSEPERLRQACVEKVRRSYSEDVVARQYMDLYTRLLKKAE